MEKIQEILKKNKKALMILGVVILIYVGYGLFFGGSDSGGFSLSYDSEAVYSDTGIGQSIIMTLNELRRIRLDTSVFEDIVFKSLVDHEVAITPVPLGRIDPFASTDWKEDDESDAQ